MPPSKQIFYLCPYNLVSFCGPIAVMAIIYSFIRIDFVFGPTHSPLLTFFLEMLSVVLLGLVISLSIWAAVLDPALCFNTERKIGDDVNEGGEERVVKAKRPFVGYDDLKLEVGTPDGLEGVWKDGYRHEEALIRL